MDAAIWAEVHGASTHFPIVMTVVAATCDLTAVFLWEKAAAAGLRSAGAIAVGVAAVGSVPAVISGLIMTRGEMLGAGALRAHHGFVWPAFGLMVVAATWRVLVQDRLSRPAYVGYVAVIGVLVGLVTASGYSGGALLQGFP